MKNSNRTFIIAVVAVLGALYLLTNCRETEFAFIGKKEATPNRSFMDKDKNDPDTNELRREAYRRHAPAPLDLNNSSPQVRALHVMTNLLAQSLQPDVTLDRVVEILREHNQFPNIRKDANGVTGVMYVVETDIPYQGTKYFRSQYFMNPDGTKYVQHMSFDFRPGPNALKEAITAVKTHFPGLGDPIDFGANGVSWAVNKNYVIEVYKYSQQDIEEGDPFHSYTAADVGAIWVSLSLNEHGEKDDHSHEHERDQSLEKDQDEDFAD